MASRTLLEGRCCHARLGLRMLRAAIILQLLQDEVPWCFGVCKCFSRDYLSVQDVQLALLLLQSDFVVCISQSECRFDFVDILIH